MVVKDFAFGGHSTQSLGPTRFNPSLRIWLGDPKDQARQGIGLEMCGDVWEARKVTIPPHRLAKERCTQRFDEDDGSLEDEGKCGKVHDADTPEIAAAASASARGQITARKTAARRKGEGASCRYHLALLRWCLLLAPFPILLFPFPFPSHPPARALHR